MYQRKHFLGEKETNEAWARVLTDRYHPGDGRIIANSLENQLRSVLYTPNPCALQEHEGKRLLARLILDCAQSGLQELTSDGSSASDTSSRNERSGTAAVARQRKSRRRIAGGAGPDTE